MEDKKQDDFENKILELKLMNELQKLAATFTDNSFIKLSSTIIDFNFKISKQTLSRKDVFEIDKDFTPVINILEQAMSMYDDIMKGE